MSKKRFAVYRDGKKTQEFSEMHWILANMFDGDNDGVSDMWQQLIKKDPSIEIKRIDGPEPVTILSADILASRDATSTVKSSQQSQIATNMPKSPIDAPLPAAQMSPTTRGGITSFFRALLLIIGLLILANIFLF